MKLADIDKNFNVTTKINEKDIKFISAKENVFDIYGLYMGENSIEYARMPLDVAKSVSEGVEYLAKNTAGGRIRFKTTSPYVVVKTKYTDNTPSANMSLAGSSSFDMHSYKDGKYKYECCFLPIPDTIDFEYIYYFNEQGEHDVVIKLPLYNSIEYLYIGLKETSEISPASKYKNKLPIVYYGSSITQGGCASRPGNSYQEIISREFDYDYINLGFSGSARAEKEMVEYLASLEMSCFVLDYDHNAPDYKYLNETHLPLYKRFREVQPNTPIIMMTMPFCPVLGDVEERKQVIKSTYDYAIKNGDTNVYFIDNSDTFDMFGGDVGTVDGCHPNDLGFMCMAKKLGEVLKNIKID